MMDKRSTLLIIIFRNGLQFTALSPYSRKESLSPVLLNIYKYILK